jgi:membrane protein implicated in regulation of membrane protease activity
MFHSARSGIYWLFFSPEEETVVAWWLWFLAGLVLAGLELASGGDFFLLLLGVSAMLVGVSVGIGLAEPLWLQVALYSVFCFVTVFWLRDKLKARFHAPREGEQVDALVGQRAVALEVLAEGGLGKVELRGTTWNARNAGPLPVAIGAGCRVKQVDGLTLHVEAE